MIVGIDVAPAYPYLSLAGFGLALFFLWRAYAYLRNTAKNMKSMSDQFGTNGESTLRAEITALGVRIDGLQALLQQKIAISESEIVQLQGLVKILQTTLGDMGLETQVRTLFQTYSKKDVADTINVIQAGAGTHMGQAASGEGIAQVKKEGGV